MLRSLRLINFQSHRDSFIEFHHGVNIIIGPSRNGKTSLLRSIRWVVENRPSGDEFRSHWAGKGTGPDQTRVVIKLNNGDIVSRIKGSAFNSYILNAQDFQGFGQDVPDPITQALNLAPINYQDQFSAPFLLFDSPGQVARYLNSVVHLEKIDTALANITSMKRTNDQDIRVQEARVIELAILEATFPDLEAAEEFIAELEGQEGERNNKVYQVENLRNCQHNLQSLRSHLSQIQLPEGIENQVLSLSNKQVHKDQLVYTKAALLGIQTKLSQARLEISRIEPALEQEAFTTKLITKNKSLWEKGKNLLKLNLYENKLDLKRTELTRILAIISQEEKRFRDEFPSVCPLCNKIWQ